MEKYSEKKIKEVVKRVVKEVVANQYRPLCEGIDYNTYNNTVKFTDEHEDNVDTSIEANPSRDERIVNGVKVWSIFRRKRSPFNDVEKLDGNPLLYALKNIDGWRFVSKANRDAFNKRMEAVVDKFLSLYQAEITVIVPSGSEVNEMLAGMIKSKAPQSVVLGDVMRKLSCDEVWGELSQLGSPFRRQFAKTPAQWRQTTIEMTDALAKMRKLRNGYFTYHLTPNKYRDAITVTLAKDDTTCARYVPEFYNKNILIIDDSISRGATIKNACDIIKDFSPNSITVLTLFSKKY